MKYFITLLFSVIVIVMSLSAPKFSSAGELNWYRQPDYPKVFDNLLIENETKNFILVIDSFLDHPYYSYCKYRVRTFKRKSSSYPFEDVVLLYYFSAPTTNNKNSYILVEAKWVYNDGLRNFWNPVANGKFRNQVLPDYFPMSSMTKNDFLKVYNRPYSLYILNTLSNSLW